MHNCKHANTCLSGYIPIRIHGGMRLPVSIFVSQRLIVAVFRSTNTCNGRESSRVVRCHWQRRMSLLNPRKIIERYDADNGAEMSSADKTLHKSFGVKFRIVSELDECRLIRYDRTLVFEYDLRENSRHLQRVFRIVRIEAFNGNSNQCRLQLWSVCNVSSHAHYQSQLFTVHTHSHHTLAHFSCLPFRTCRG